MLHYFIYGQLLRVEGFSGMVNQFGLTDKDGPNRLKLVRAKTKKRQLVGEMCLCGWEITAYDVVLFGSVFVRENNIILQLTHLI